MKNIILILIGLIAINSCSFFETENNLANTTFNDFDSQNKTYSLNEAIKNLQTFYSSIGYVTKAEKEIAEIFAVCYEKSTLTKSSTIEDTLLYVVNYSNNEGFAILAASKNLPTDIIAIGEYGTMNEDNFIYSGNTFTPEGLIMSYANNIITTITDTVADITPYKPTENPVTQINDDYVYIEGEWVSTHWDNWEISKDIPEMLKTHWHQDAPFNNLVYPKDAGCTTIALLQVIAYNNFPEYHFINRVHIPYNILRELETIPENSAYSEIVALFVQNFHNFAFDVHFSNSTLIFPTAAKKYLESIGYKNVSLYRDYKNCNTDLIIESLYKNYPVIISAKANGLNAHTWVIDGYLQQTREGVKIGSKTGKNYGTDFESREFVHCNWGWKGNKDGYFYAGIFDSNNPIEIHRTPTKSGSDGNYDSYFRVITYEIPK